MIKYGNSMSGKEYNYLREAVEFRKLGEEQAQRGLDHTTYIAVAREDGKIVGMARVLFDFGYTACISDVIILPEYQGRGIGSTLLRIILQFLEDNSKKGEFVLYSLNAAKGKEEFYEKFGFVRRPNDISGAGMTKQID